MTDGNKGDLFATDIKYHDCGTLLNSLVHWQSFS